MSALNCIVLYSYFAVQYWNVLYSTVPYWMYCTARFCTPADLLFSMEINRSHCMAVMPCNVTALYSTLLYYTTVHVCQCCIPRCLSTLCSGLRYFTLCPSVLYCTKNYSVLYYATLPEWLYCPVLQPHCILLYLYVYVESLTAETLCVLVGDT